MSGGRPALLLAALAVGACAGDPLDARGTVLEVRVVRAEFELEPVFERVRGSMDLTMENKARRSILYGPCSGGVLEREVDREWIVAWTDPCILGEGDVELEFLPGSRHEIRLLVDTRLGQAPSQLWTAPVEGRYRLRLRAGMDGALLHPLSAPFDPTVTVGGGPLEEMARHRARAGAKPPA
jgi:hypothetical protein